MSTPLDEYLEKKLRSPDLAERAGARSVIEFLKKVRKQSEEENGFENIEKILGR